MAQLHVKPELGGERAVIERIRARAKGMRGGNEVRLGIGDDAAVLRPRPGEEIVVTTDFSLEGRHFTRDKHPAESAGWRALARGLSDLAAMGARPVAAFLSLALPRDATAAWVDGFLDGLMLMAHQAKVPLAGGDTSEAPGTYVLADVGLLGAVARGSALRRDGARAGDGIYVTGALGGSAAELAAVLAGTARAGSDRKAHPHLYPQPRLDVGVSLRKRRIAAAAMDLSDGLSTDLRHLCEASGVRAEVEAARLPLHPLASAHGEAEALRLALNGGEDYELLFTARRATKVPRSVCGVPVTRIGTVLPADAAKPTVELIAPDGSRQELQRGGWEHLR